MSYPLVICYIAIENGDYYVDLSIDSMVDLSSSLCKRLPGRVSRKHPLNISRTQETSFPTAMRHP